MGFCAVSATPAVDPCLFSVSVYDGCIHMHGSAERAALELDEGVLPEYKGLRGERVVGADGWMDGWREVR